MSEAASIKHIMLPANGALLLPKTKASTSLTNPAHMATTALIEAAEFSVDWIEAWLFACMDALATIQVSKALYSSVVLTPPKARPRKRAKRLLTIVNALERV